MTSVKSVAKQIQSNNLGTGNSPQLSNMESANSRTLTAGQAANMAIQVNFLKLNFSILLSRKEI